MPPVSLSSLRKGARGTVASVRDDAQSLGDEARSPPSVAGCSELGFIAGELFEVLGAVPGGDPLAVRVGDTLFALRRRGRARCIASRGG